MLSKGMLAVNERLPPWSFLLRGSCAKVRLAKTPRSQIGLEVVRDSTTVPSLTSTHASLLKKLNVSLLFSTFPANRMCDCVDQGCYLMH